MFAMFKAALASAFSLLRPANVGSTVDGQHLRFGSAFRLVDAGQVKLGSAFRLVEAPAADTGRIKLGSAFRLTASAA